MLIVCLLGLYRLTQAQEQLNINENLDNYTIQKAYEDTGEFKKKKVYSVYSYQLANAKNIFKKTKTFDGKKYNLLSYTEYLPDRRKRYKEYEYDQIERVEKYHYDEDFKNLHLLELIEDNKRFDYHWLFYDKDQILSEDIHYRIYGDNEFDYEGYTQYHKKTNGSKHTITINNFGYDTLAEPSETYIFNYPTLIKETPLFQSRKTTCQMIRGYYLPVNINSFVIDGREITLNYNGKGLVTSEIWHRNNTLEHKKEYYYSEDGNEKTEQDYHMQGTEKSTKTTGRYDENGNLIFKQSIEYTGTPLGIHTFEYKYDVQGNWIERKTYYQSVHNGITADRELKDIEIREIKYYSETDRPKQFQLPQFPEKAHAIRNTIPQLSGAKQEQINAFDEAVKSGNFDSEIVIKEANSIENFTPKFWKLIEVAYGNLDVDLQDEAVVVYETPIAVDPGYQQSLAIYKKISNGWKLWHQSTSPILSTQAGGMMGNPFEGIAIDRKCIVVNHFGGSRQKWNLTHRYRFQNNNWYVIGATVSFGAPCDYFDTLDYNLVTGDILVEHTTEECDDDNADKRIPKNRKEKLKIKKPLQLMDDFTPGKNEIEIWNETRYY